MLNASPSKKPPVRRHVYKIDVVRQTGLDIRAVNRLIASGDLKTAKIPGGVRAIVLQSSVDELITKMNGSDHEAS
jgi:hypothetical protein